MQKKERSEENAVQVITGKQNAERVEQERFETEAEAEATNHALHAIAGEEIAELAGQELLVAKFEATKTE